MTSLERRLGTLDAVVVGLGAMLGAGVFVAVAPAAAAAGSLLLVGLALAAVVATCNALSSAQLAAVHPSSGGTYVYGRRQLGPFWGHLAGFGFVVGKTASCAAMALTVGAYAAPALARPLAVAAVVALTAVNLRGIAKTARLTRVLVAGVLVALALVVGAALAGGTASTRGLGQTDGVGAYDVLQSAGLLFFAFAGYARITTLGEEVRDPARTIPRAVPIALGIVLAVYWLVAVTALAAVGPAVLAASPAPLASVVDAGSLSILTPVVRVGGAVAALGVLLSLLAGVSRTTLAMAREGELPRPLATVDPVHKVPRTAELAVAAAVVVLVLLVDLRGAIGFSSFAVLVYYAVANASALTLPREQRRYPQAVAVVGLLGCLVLAVTLPLASVLAGLTVLALGSVVFVARVRLHARRAQPGSSPTRR